MSVPGKIGVREFFRILLSYRTGKAGLAMLGVMLALSLYALAVLPPNYGTNYWSNAEVWKDYPRLAPPDWYRYFDSSLLPNTILVAQRPTLTGTATLAGTSVAVFTYTFEYDYNYPTFPQDVRLAVYGLTAYNATKPVVLSVSVTRPDGEVPQLYSELIPVPPDQQGEKTFYPYAKDINAFGNGIMANALASFYAMKYGIAVAPSTLLGLGVGVERALFARPMGAEGNLTLVPLNGHYTFTVTLTLTSTKDTVDKVTLAIIGRAYGLMGTDNLGRDLAQVLLFGFPVALLIGVVTSLAASSIGTSLGLISGYFGGRIDEVIQRSSDTLNNFPLLPLLILLTFLVPTQERLVTILLVLVIFGWAGLAIIIRSMVLSIKAEGYVEAARAVGATDGRIMFRHVLPQVLPYAVAQLIFLTPGAILTEAALSVLGLGDPSIPTWGQVLEGVLRAGAVSIAWWWALPPGLLIIFSAVTFVLLALTLEPIVDPRLRKR